MIERYPSPDRLGRKPENTDFLARFGRIGTKFETTDYEARTYGARRLAVVGVAIATLLSGLGLYKLDQMQTEPIKDCIAERTGQEFDIDINPQSGEIIAPETMNQAEQTAYEACINEQN